MITKARLSSVRALCAMLATVLTVALLGAVPANAINNWGTVTSNIDGSANTVGQPQSAASADGSVVITVYREYVSSKMQINYLIGTVDQNVQTWGTAGVVAVPPSGNYERPYVAISADGTKATATWNLLSTTYSASATISGRVATWGTATPVSSGSATKRLALSSDGTRAFSLALNGSSSIHANTATIDGTTQTWGTASAIGSAGRSVNAPVATLSGDGLRGVAMWTEKDGAPTDPSNLASRAFTVSGSNATWGTLTPVTPVSTSGNTVSYPAGFASTDSSRISAVWQKSNGATPTASYEIQSASATVSGDSITWGDMTVLDSFTGANVYSYPQMAGARDGSRATATWMSDVNANTKLHANSVTVTGSGQSWGTKHTFGGAGSSTEYQSKLRVSEDGQTAVVGLGRFSSPQSLLSATGQIEGNAASWGELSTVSSGAATEVLLTLSANGLFATLVWHGAGGRLLSMSGNTLLPPPTITSISPNSGPLAGGQVIKIKGDNLPLTTSVTIGGLACTELTWDLMAGELSCLVPAGAVAGAVDVVVTTPTGSATGVGGYTYTGGAEPAVQVPNKPRKVKVAGSPTSKKFRISWTEPTQTEDGRPVERYRATIVQKGPKKLILKKWVPSSKTKITVSRKYLLKHSKLKPGKYAASGVRPRGDVVFNDLRYRIRIEAFNSLGGGPVATTHLRVRI